MLGNAVDVKAESNYPKIGKLQMDLMVAALQCGLTRVASLQWGNSNDQCAYSWLGVNTLGHDLAHNNSNCDGNHDKKKKVFRWYSEQFAYLLGKLTAVHEGDGTMLDNTVVLWASEFSDSNGHASNKLLWFLAGNAGGALKQGRVIDCTGRGTNDLLTALSPTPSAWPAPSAIPPTAADRSRRSTASSCRIWHDRATSGMPLLAFAHALSSRNPVGPCASLVRFVRSGARELPDRAWPGGKESSRGRSRSAWIPGETMKKAVKLSAALAAFAASSFAASAEAAYVRGVGFTEIAVCPTSTFTDHWGHPFSQWGSRGSFLSHATPASWWTYADPGILQSVNCNQWKNGILVGGATLRAGSPSVPQGVNVKIYSYWNDWNVPSTWTQQNQCGHMHVATYVWGWRFNGSAWGYEFVKAHTFASYWDTAAQRCKFKADGNPEYPAPNLDMYAFGPAVITINNSPYPVLYTKSQATSHRNAGCGEFECYHPLMVIAQY